jgi:hypothetical protein
MQRKMITLTGGNVTFLPHVYNIDLYNIFGRARLKLVNNGR